MSTSAVQSSTQVTFTATLDGVTRQATLVVNAPAPTLASAQLLASPVTGGQGSTLRVTLSGAAPAGGVTVTLSSGNTGVATVAASVQVPSGSSSADAPVSTSAVQSATQVVFNATLASVTRQATLTVNPAAVAPALVSVALGAPQILGGESTTFTITLSAVAPQGGLAVGLSSTNAGAAAIPPSVTVPAGSSSAQVGIATSAVGSATPVSLAATLSSVTRQATLTLTPPAVSALAVNPSSVQGGTGANCTLTLNGRAPAGGLLVALQSSNTAAAIVPLSVMVGGGQTSANFQVATQAVNAATTVQLQASASGRSVSANLGVNPAEAPAPVLRGLAASYSASALRLDITAVLSAPAPAGGARVGLGANNNGVANLAGQQILIPAGAVSGAASFTVTPPAGSIVLTVTGTVGASTRSASLLVWNPTVTIDAIRAPATIGVNQWVVATVTLTGPAPANGPAPALSVSGAIGQTQWVFPLSAGRNNAIFAYRASARGAGTVSVSYGGVTKSIAVTVQ